MIQVAFLEKGDKSPVTIADFGSQALVCQCLAAAFPDDVIVAEMAMLLYYSPSVSTKTRAMQR
jgi:3'-phosphoadenosine 5'-phosphosulfate (PAPS) 3'-phosphatase